MTNLTDANRYLVTQVAEQSNHMGTKDIAMETITKLIQQLQGEIKTLNTKQAGQSTKKPDSASYNKGNLWSNKHCWTHGLGRNDVEACKYKSDFHKYKAKYLNSMGRRMRDIPEGT